MPRHSEATKSAIKNRTDIVALVGEYLPLRRVGTSTRRFVRGMTITIRPLK